MKLSNGYVTWEGISMIDGRTPIVQIVTSIVNPSQNIKTGPLAQVYYLLRDIHPLDAIKFGLDRAVCGLCELRPSSEGG